MRRPFLSKEDIFWIILIVITLSLIGLTFIVRETRNSDHIDLVIPAVPECPK